MQQYGREPSADEIAQQMEMPADKVRKVLKIVKEPVSLETPIGDDEESSLGDFVEDRQTLSPADAAMALSLEEQTRKVLATLTPREEQILRLRFGIGEKSDYTLEEVGQRFAVTRERIRQIEAKALRKLRSPNRVAHPRDRSSDASRRRGRSCTRPAGAGDPRGEPRSAGGRDARETLEKELRKWREDRAAKPQREAPPRPAHRQGERSGGRRRARRSPKPRDG